MNKLLKLKNNLLYKYFIYIYKLFKLLNKIFEKK